MKTENHGITISMLNDSGDPILANSFVNTGGYLGNSEEDNNTLLGVCVADTEAGDMMPVVISGIVNLTSGDYIGVGNKVSVDGTSVYAVNFSDPPLGNELQKVVGMALDSASASGEQIRVLLK